MSRLRRFGLALTFAVTFASGVLISQPAQAATRGFCPRLAAYISYLEGLNPTTEAGQKLVAFLLSEAETIYGQFCD